MHLQPVLTRGVRCPRTAHVPFLGGASPPTLEQSHPRLSWGQPAPLQSPGPAVHVEDLRLQLLDRSRLLLPVPLAGSGAMLQC